MNNKELLKLSDRLNKILDKVTDDNCKPLNNAGLSTRDIRVLKGISEKLYVASEIEKE